MRFGSVCSGIEAASVAWNSIGWEAAWFSEIEKFPAQVLAHHYPDVQNLGDMTTLVGRLLSREIEAPDILCGGTPCQAFSVAGRRESLDDERGNLSLTFCRIANAIDEVRYRAGKQATAVFWENVPGVLSTKDNAFGCFLAELCGEQEPLIPSGKRWTNAGAVYGPKRAVAWRVLNAKHFGVAQSRKRVFVIASARDGFDPSEILFESESLSGNPPTSKSEGQGITTFAESSFGTFRTSEVAAAVKASGGCLGGGSESLVYANHPADSRVTELNETCSTVTSRYGTGGGNVPLVLQPTVLMDQGGPEICPTLLADAGDNQIAIAQAMAVRRLTPTECERLQGFPDGYTDIKPNGKPTPDGPRYKALGNSWAVPCARWIGQRIQEYTNKLDIKDKEVVL
jgi:DNA (cytosine-5)-methyltransferase 1